MQAACLVATLLCSVLSHLHSRNRQPVSTREAGLSRRAAAAALASRRARRRRVRAHWPWPRIPSAPRFALWSILRPQPGFSSPGRALSRVEGRTSPAPDPARLVSAPWPSARPVHGWAGAAGLLGRWNGCSLTPRPSVASPRPCQPPSGAVLGVPCPVGVQGAQRVDPCRRLTPAAAASRPPASLRALVGARKDGRLAARSSGVW